MKRGKVLSLLMVAIVALIVSCESTGYHQDPRGSWSADEGYAQLLGAKCFAFGGVGFVGLTSDGEFAFRAVLKSPKATELFNEACSKATAEGRLYALCGIRATDRNAFHRYAQAWQADTKSVTTMSGCMIEEMETKKVVEQIMAGRYDYYLKLR